MCLIIFFPPLFFIQIIDRWKNSSKNWRWKINFQMFFPLFFCSCDFLPTTSSSLSFVSDCGDTHEINCRENMKSNEKWKIETWMNKFFAFFSRYFNHPSIVTHSWQFIHFSIFIWFANEKINVYVSVFAGMRLRWDWEIIWKEPQDFLFQLQFFSFCFSFRNESILFDGKYLHSRISFFWIHSNPCSADSKHFTFRNPSSKFFQFKSSWMNVHIDIP